MIAGSACQSVHYTDRGNPVGAFTGNNWNSPKRHNDVSPSLLKKNRAESTEKISCTSENTLPPIIISSYKNTLNGLGNLNLRNSQEIPAKKVKKEIKKIIETNTIRKYNNDNPQEGSIRWFVYLLLCFLIPPLAYYLIKRQTDTLFWVCLLCFLLTSTFLGGFQYGLLGLLSIVIALLTLFKIDI